VYSGVGQNSFEKLQKLPQKHKYRDTLWNASANNNDDDLGNDGNYRKQSTNSSACSIIFESANAVNHFSVTSSSPKPGMPL